MAGRVHVHPPEGRQSRVEEALLDGRQLHALEGRVLVRVAGDIHGVHAVDGDGVHSNGRHLVVCVAMVLIVLIKTVRTLDPKCNLFPNVDPTSEQVK